MGLRCLTRTRNIARKTLGQESGFEGGTADMFLLREYNLDRDNDL